MLSVLQRLYRLLDRRGRWQILTLFALSGVSGLLELCGVTSTLPFMALASNPQVIASPGRIHDFYTWAGSPEPRFFLVMLGLSVLASLTLSNLLVGLSSWLGLKFANEQQKRLSVNLFRNYLSRSYLWHVDNHPNTQIYNLSQSRNLVAQSFSPAVQLVVRLGNVGLLMGAVIYFNPVAAVTIATTLIVLYGGSYVICRKKLMTFYTKEWHIGERIGRTVTEPISGFKSVRLAGLESQYLDKYGEQMEQFGEIQRYKMVAIEFPRLVIQTVTYGSILGLVIFLVYQHGGGDSVIGQASLYALAGYRLIPNMQQYFQSLSQLEAGRIGLENLYNDLTESVPDLAVPPAPLPIHDSVGLSHVTFGYSENPLFRNLSLEIPKNTCVAFVGPTGKGKTTLVNILVGLLTPQQGHLQVDGRNLQPDQLRPFQRNIGYVPQDTYLCDDTLWRNIALGENEPDRERAWKAAQAARVDEFAKDLPNQMDTVIGERGVRLSGGQRQRVGIARALYRDPELLVFDEATSALDNLTEVDVMRSIRLLAQTHTIVVVAHRLSTVRECDLIYYIDEGGIRAQGTYDELLEKSPDFRNLASKTSG